MRNYFKCFFLALALFLGSYSSYTQTIPGTVSGSTTFCTTSNSGFLSLAGQNGTILFWQLSTNGGANWIYIGNTTQNQTYFNLNQTTCYRAVVQNGVFPADTSAIACINIFPTAIAGTLSGGGVFCGSNAAGFLTLSGTAGNILNWESSINNGTSWNAITNTTNTQNIGGITQTTLFRVIVKSGSCPGDTSNIVTVTVTPQTVAGTISGPASVCIGNSGNLTLTGNTGTIIDWIASTNNGTSWSSLGNTTPNQSFTNLTQTTWYRAIVQSGSCNIDSTTTQIVVADPPTDSGTLTGGSSFCGITASGMLTLSGYTGSILGWESSINNGTTWNSIINTTNTENITGVAQTTLYRVIVQSGNCPSEISNIDSAVIVPQTVPGSITGPGTVCIGSDDVLTLTGHIGTIIDWITSTDNGVSWSSLGNIAPNYNFSNLTQTTWYQVIVQSGNCNIDSTATEIITVDAPSVSGTLTGGNAFCGNTATGVLSLSGNTGNIVNWESSINNGTTWSSIANTTSTENIAGVTQTTLYRVIVQNGVCPSDTSNIDTVFVTPETVPGTVNSDLSVCDGNNQFDLTLSGNVGDVLFWQESTDNGINWTTIVNTTTLISLNNLTQETLYRAMVQSGDCNIDSTNNVTITILPVPIASAGNDTLIYLGASLTLNGSGTGTPLWSPTLDLDSADIFTPYTSPTTTTSYTLTVTAPNGCSSTDIVIVTVEDTTSINNDLVITTLFSPNGDGINDFWHIKNIENKPNNEVFVYNTYGQLIFFKKEYTNDWAGTSNGNNLPDGTYYYVVKVDDTSTPQKGMLDILR